MREILFKKLLSIFYFILCIGIISSSAIAAPMHDHHTTNSNQLFLANPDKIQIDEFRDPSMHFCPIKLHFMKGPFCKMKSYFFRNFGSDSEDKEYFLSTHCGGLPKEEVSFGLQSASKLGFFRNIDKKWHFPCCFLNHNLFIKSSKVYTDVWRPPPAFFL